MADVSSIKSLISTIVPGDLSNLITIFSYQGFNPEMVFKHLAVIKTEKNISDEDFKSDITALVVLGCIAGNYTAKNKDKRDEKGTAKADEMYTKYKMQMGSVGNNKRAVTLPRLLLTFPILTWHVMMECPERNFSGPFGSANLPQVMKTPVFPSLIPATFGIKSKEALLIAYTAYTCDQSKAINSEMKNLSPSEIFKEQYVYVKIGHQSPEPIEIERKRNFIEITKVLEFSWNDICKVLRVYVSEVEKSYVIPSKFGSVSTIPEQTPDLGADLYE